MNNKRFKQLVFHGLGLFLLGITSLALTYFLQVSVQYQTLPMFSDAFSYFMTHPFVYGISTIFIFLIGILISLIVGSIYIGTGINSMIWAALAYGSYVKMTIRNEPIYPTELGMIRNAKELTSMINMKQVILIVLVMLICLTLLAVLHVFLKRKLDIPKQGKKSYLLRAVLLVPTLMALAQFYYVSSKPTPVAKAMTAHGIWNQHFDQASNYRDHGFVLAFLMNATVEKPQKPEGYSKQAVAEIVDRYEKKAAEANKSNKDLPKKLNVNLILSESLTDINFPDIKKYFEVNENPLEFVTSLRENPNAVVGTMISDQYGGGTANVEYEVVTGMSNNFMNQNISAYQNIVPQFRRFPSIANTLKDKNFDITALHPYSPFMYKRSVDYPILGIDNFVTVDQMKNLKTNPYGLYSTDQSLYDLTYKTWKKQSNNKNGQFNFLLTMQNHMPYEDNTDPKLAKKAKIKPISVETTQAVQDENIEGYDLAQLRNYVNSLKMTDEALQNLYDKVMAQKEPTIVALFGDHRPGGMFDFLRDEKDPMSRATTVIYFANFKLKNKKLGQISPNAVLPNMYDLAGFKRSPWYEMILDVQSQIPVLTYQFKVDSKGKALSKDELERNQAYRDYQMIDYDQNFGRQYADKLNFFE